MDMLHHRNEQISCCDRNRAFSHASTKTSHPVPLLAHDKDSMLA